MTQVQSKFMELNNMKIKEVNAATGEEIVRDATAEEIAQREKDIAETMRLDALKAEKEIQRAAILDRLGLTEQEVKLLLS